jgi:ribosomal protein L24E
MVGLIGALALVGALVVGPTGTAGSALRPAITTVACFGSLAGVPLNKPIVGIAPTPDGAGYWLVATDGGVFSFGSAHFYGSTGAIHLNQPIVGMASTPSGHGYWLVASDGGIFSFGDAQFYGSTGSLVLNKPVVGMASTPSGHGYWLVASDGGIFSFGDAQFYGSTGAIRLNQPIVGMAATGDGNGYWLAAADAGIFTFGDAAYLGGGPISQDNQPYIRDFSAFAASTDGGGYIIANSSRGFLLNFGDAKYYGLGFTASDTSSLAGLTSPEAGAGYGYWEVTQAGSVYALTAGSQATC